MKTNKKAIFGMLVAMVMSLGMMGGINSKTNDVSTQQWAAISYYCGNNSEGTAGQVVGKALGGCFNGAAAGIVMAGIATGGVGLVAGLAWGGVVAS